MNHKLSAVVVLVIFIASMYTVCIHNNREEVAEPLDDVLDSRVTPGAEFNESLRNAGYYIFPARLVTWTEEIQGMGFCDYSQLLDDKNVTYGCGFYSESVPIGLVYQGSQVIPDLAHGIGYKLTTVIDELAIQYVSGGVYCKYEVRDGIGSSVTQPLIHTCTQDGYIDEIKALADPSISLYDYDSEKYINYVSDSISPLQPFSFKQPDYESIRKTLDDILDYQDGNFKHIDIESVSILAKEALEAYLEYSEGGTFMGYPLSEIDQYMSSLGPDQYIRITLSEGISINIIEETLDFATRLLCGIACVAVIAAGVALTCIPGANIAVAVISGAVISAAADLFAQTVISGKEPNPFSIICSVLGGAIAGPLGIFMGGVVDAAMTGVATYIETGGSVDETLISAGMALLAGVLAGKFFQKVFKTKSSVDKGLNKEKIDTLDNNSTKTESQIKAIESQGKAKSLALTKIDTAFPKAKEYLEKYGDWERCVYKKDPNKNSHYFEFEKNQIDINGRWLEHVSLHENNGAPTLHIHFKSVNNVPGDVDLVDVLVTPNGIKANYVDEATICKGDVLTTERKILKDQIYAKTIKAESPNLSDLEDFLGYTFTDVDNLFGNSCWKYYKALTYGHSWKEFKKPISTNTTTSQSLASVIGLIQRIAIC